MDTKASLKKISGVLLVVAIAVILFMTVPVNAANVSVDASPRSGGTTTLKVTLQNAPDEILLQADRGPIPIAGGMSAAGAPRSGFMELLNVTLKYPNGTVVNLDPADALITSTEEQGMGTGYGVPLAKLGYAHGLGYGYDDWFGYGYTGNVVDVVLTWSIELNDGLYTLKADMPSTLNDRGDVDDTTFRVGTTSSGGGTGDGGAYGGTLPPLQGQNITIDISQIQGATNTLRLGDIVTFTINGETHTGTILSLNSNYAVIEFMSEPIRVTVSVGQTQEVDLDADGTKDISVYLSSITNGDAVFTFNKIVPKAPTTAPASTGTVTTTTQTAAGQPEVTVTQAPAPVSWTTFAIAIVLAGIAVAAVWWVMKKKK